MSAQRSDFLFEQFSLVSFHVVKTVCTRRARHKRPALYIFIQSIHTSIEVQDGLGDIIDVMQIFLVMAKPCFSLHGGDAALKSEEQKQKKLYPLCNKVCPKCNSNLTAFHQHDVGSTPKPLYPLAGISIVKVAHNHVEHFPR